MSEDTKTPDVDGSEPEETTPVEAAPTRPEEASTAPDESSVTPVADSPPVEGETPAGEVDAQSVEAPAAVTADKAGAKPDAESSPDPSAGHGDKAKSEGAKQRRKPRFPALMRAFRTHVPVEGTVEKVIKGGYEVKVAKARGFCPHSQIALEREDDPESHVGQTHQFRIMQLRRGGEDLVLSRRAILDDRRAEEAKAVRATLIEGAVMQGHVAGMAPFGAFVDLGAGVQGLVHISELSHKRVSKVEDAVKIGDTVQVKVLKVNDKSGRLSLSIRSAQEDPWSGILERFLVGSVYPGKIVRLADFGAFVEMAPGLEALAPASEFPPSPTPWRDALEVGSTRDWQVLSVSPKERRFSITIPGEGADPGAVEVNATLEGKVQRIENYGVFVWLAPGKVGLMPRAWTGSPAGTELNRRFSIGESVEVTVVEITEGGRRIRLTRKGVEPEAPQARPKRQPREEYQPAPKTEPEEPFGTSLAEKLRAALGQSDS